MSAPDAIRSLAAGLAPRLRAMRALMVLQAYIDDSGNGQQPVFVLAGFLAPYNHWEKFTIEWDNALRAEPKINYFKMNEAVTKRKQFFGWAKEDVDKKCEKLAQIIKNNVEFGFSAVININLYNSVFNRDTKVVTHKPHFLMFHSIIISLLKFQGVRCNHEEIDFIFDEQQEVSDLVMAEWSRFVDSTPEQLRPIIKNRPIHRDDKKFVPLQASDMLAWHIRRYYFEESHNCELKSDLWEIIRDIPLLGSVIKKEALENIAKGFW